MLSRLWNRLRELRPRKSTPRYISHLPRCPACGGSARSSSLRNRFECTRCGRIFS